MGTRLTSSASTSSMPMVLRYGRSSCAARARVTSSSLTAFMPTEHFAQASALLDLGLSASSSFSFESPNDCTRIWPSGRPNRYAGPCATTCVRVGGTSVAPSASSADCSAIHLISG